MKLITNHPLKQTFPYALQFFPVVENYTDWFDKVHNTIGNRVERKNYMISPITGTIYCKNKNDALLIRMLWTSDDH